MDYRVNTLSFLSVRDQTTSTGESLGLLNWTGNLSWGYEISNCLIWKATGISVLYQRRTQRRNSLI